MTTAYTSLLGLALPVTGELSGTWGDTVNDYITKYMDAAVAGAQTISGTQTAVTLSVTNGSALSQAGTGGTGSAQYQIINCTGSPASLLTITVPAQSKVYLVINATSTSQSVKVVGSGPTTGVTIISGEKALIAWNGSDFVKVATTAAAGGSNTQVQYNSSGVLAGSANLTFDGTSLTLGGNPTLSAGTANGVLYLNGSKVATTGSALTFDGTNLGVGQAPQTWTSSYRAVQVGLGGSLSAYNSSVYDEGYYGQNFFENTSGQWRYINNGYASQYWQAQGKHNWRTAGNNTSGADQPLTWTTAMVLDASGQLGIGTSSPSYKLDVASGTGFPTAKFSRSGTTAQTGAGYIGFSNIGFSGSTNADMLLRSDYGIGFQINNATSATTAAVIDLSGNLGIGTSSPSAKLTVYAGADGDVGFFRGGSTRQVQIGTSSTAGYINTDNGSAGLEIRTQGTARMYLDNSGNLGLGVTPSAWGSNYRAVEVSGAVNVFGNTGDANFAGIGANLYNNNTNYLYRYSTLATMYLQDNGTHQWHYAASGTAGNAISFTQAMTLTAAGELLVGGTSVLNGSKFLVTGNVDGEIKQSIINTNTGASADARLDIGNASYTASELTLAALSQTSSGTFFGISKAKLKTIFDNSSTADSNGLLIGTSGANPLYFGTNSTERARITSGGYFKASDSGSYNSSTGTYHELYQTADSPGVLIRATNATFTDQVLSVLGDRQTTNSSYNLINARNGNLSGQFIVRDSGNAVNTNGSYGTISDAKMKTDIVDAGSQWADIKAIRFRKFKMKNDPSGLLQLGVVAQELEQTSPGLVDETIDRDQEGNDLGTTTKSVKTSVLLMKAAVALQEAMARIEKLEAEVSALKGA